MKKLVVALLCVMMLALTAGATLALAQAKHVIRFATAIEPESHYANGMRKFKELAEKYSNGAIEVQLFYSGQLGDERALVEAMGMGMVEMAICSSAPMVNFSKDFMVFDLPFLVTDRAKAFAVLDGPVGQKILATMESKGVKSLGFWENGFRNITNSKLAIRTPEDLKGIKIRTMENPIHMDLFSTLGANPTPMAWGELFLALQQGTVDAQENPLIIIETSKYPEVQKYLTLTGHVYAPSVVSISKSIFEAYPKEIQDVILKAEKEARDWERDFCIQKDNELVAVLVSQGMEAIEVDKAAWAKAAAPVYEHFKNEINQDYVKAFTGK
ncbi:MAG: TRAP transporter substrate-binding protein [Candidatus Adiutrix sp.]|jgi:tripartite ATP-independent transporter DctP family solute receptor|nr:TRAP transporter substrate-binding protein [Candidatus Adiutrix sp.]